MGPSSWTADGRVLALNDYDPADQKIDFLLLADERSRDSVATRGSSDEKRSGRDGPMAALGTYQARPTVGDWTQTVSFETRMDPRIITEGTVTEADVTAQVELVLKARDALSSARRAATRLGKALEERPDDETLLEIKKALIPALPKAGSVWKAEPMILDQLVYLYQNRPATRPRRLRALRATGRRTSGGSGKARCNRGSRTDRLE